MPASNCRSLAPLCAVIVSLFACLACKPSAEIDSYTVERTSPPREPFVAAEVANELHRMLTAMVPVDDEVYFFKLVSKKPVVDRYRDEFESFISGIGKGDSADAPLTWTLPAGWTEKGPSPMRINTVVIPDDAGELEIAISSLPLSGSWDDFVAMNVNRWLGQLNQSSLPRQTIINLTKQLSTDAGPATVIELAGVFTETSPMMNPHGHAAAAERGAPASQAPTIEAPPASGNLAFETPEGWERGPASPMREATFFAGTGEQRAEFSLSGWPAAGGSQMSDVTANVQRWAAEVGLPADEAPASLVEDIDIDGTKGHYVELVGPESGKATTAAMVVRGDKVWFFKLTGPTDIVKAEKENFRQFVDSVEFK